MPVFLSEEDLRRFGDELDRFRSDLFKREFLSRVVAFPHVRDLFEAVRGDGKRIVLASSAKGDELKAYKDKAGIADLVDSETSSDDAERSKPHPDIFQAALAAAGLRHDRAVVVGDTPYDAIAAGKAGLKTVGLLSGGFPERDLRESGCVEIWKGPDDLWRNYGRSLLARL